jgi:hypothetical protein
MMARMPLLHALASVLLVLPSVQDSGYRLPPPEIVRILDAEPTPSVDFSPDARWMLFIERPAMPSIADVVRPWVGLAGMRIDPTLVSERRVSFVRALSLRPTSPTSPATGAELQRIELPDGARIGNVEWSPDSTHVAFTLATDAGLDLWIAEAATARARKLAANLNGVLDEPFRFADAGRSLVVRLVPQGRTPPAPRTVPAGPALQETSGGGFFGADRTAYRPDGARDRDRRGPIPRQRDRRRGHVPRLPRPLRDPCRARHRFPG